ncbi:MAG: hypothetical protein FWF78_08615 [Defluviitaleaceae bacterium]|nr:hypothetical protein [Defluviitaleaceae bacterium]
MTATKGAIIRTVEKLDDRSADFVLDWLTRNFMTVQMKDPWDMIEEVDPDEFDLDMLNEIERNADCGVFMTEEEMDAKRAAARSPVTIKA